MTVSTGDIVTIPGEAGLFEVMPSWATDDYTPGDVWLVRIEFNPLKVWKILEVWSVNVDCLQIHEGGIA